MSLTSFNNDPARIKKSIDESVYPGNYYLNTPGWGENNLCYFEDPQIRQQYFAGNMESQIVSLESNLLGYNSRIELKKNEKKGEPKTFSAGAKNPHKDVGYLTNESRTTHPAWTYRDLEYHHYEEPILNPQFHLEPPFYNNLQTRILAKNAWDQRSA